MREILFRAISKSNKNQWIYGSLAPNNHILTKVNKFWIKNTPIISETIGEYSGCRDINNVRIFENDIVYSGEEKDYGIVIFVDGMFMIEYNNSFRTELGWENRVKVIGNSYEKE